MPAASKKQQNYFKLVQSFKEEGERGFFKKWKELFNNRPFPNKEYVQKIADTSKKIKDEDLQDLTSGIEGEEIIGDKREFKVGYWALFKGKYRPLSNQEEVKDGVFIAKIKRIDFQNKIVNFAEDGLFNKFGTHIGSLLRTNISHPEFKFLDYAYFKDVIKTSKNKSDMIEKREITEMIRKTVREILNEMFYPYREKTEEIVDADGEKIITGRFVKYGKKKGVVLGLTGDLKVRVKWISPVEEKDKKEVIEPKELYVYD